MFDHVYVDRHSLVESEREQYAAYLDSFSGTDDTAARGGH